VKQLRNSLSFISCLILSCAANLSGCSPEPLQTPEPASVPARAPLPFSFKDVAAETGLDFRHTNGASAAKYFPETMGGGGAFIDFDNDGWLDIYAVNGGWIADASSDAPRNALFRNQAGSGFTDVSAGSGSDDDAYGMGAAAADFDNDGFTDLYVTNYGPNLLLHNRADGTFADITARSATGSPHWGTSSAFGDYDLDGDVDLYVANYVTYTPQDHSRDAVPYMASSENADTGELGYPHPANFPASADQLYRNRGDGTFEETTRQAGIYNEDGKGLGVVFADYNNDGWPDIYVANDAVRNQLFRNQGDATFAETAVLAGTAYGQDGQMEAGMGADWGDWDNDGDLDLTVTNFQAEPNALYRNDGDGFFAVATFSSGAGLATLPFLGFGTQFLDVDNDGNLDLFVANGHVLDNVEHFDRSTTYPQRNLLFHNMGPKPREGPRFVDVSLHSGSGMALIQAGRGSATGDYDNDGDLDILVFNVGQEIALLRNDGGNSGNWLQLALTGTEANRHAIGARVRLKAGDQIQTREVRGDRSYLSHSDHRLHFGLGKNQQADWIEIHWPGGDLLRYQNLAANRLFFISQGGEPTERRR
jgi:enediyne biosynthesis protein E4